MAQQDVTGDIVRAALDRTSSGQHGGSISLVLAIATALVGATAGLVLIGRGHAEPYVLGFLALMAMIGVFLLFALAAGILRMAGKDAATLFLNHGCQDWRDIIPRIRLPHPSNPLVATIELKSLDSDQRSTL